MGWNSVVQVLFNFFDLGYTSLTINTFKEQLESRLGISIEKMMFYRYPTVKSLAAFIYFSRHPEEAEPAGNRQEIYDNARKKLLTHIRQLRPGRVESNTANHK